MGFRRNKSKGRGQIFSGGMFWKRPKGSEAGCLGLEPPAAEGKGSTGKGSAEKFQGEDQQKTRRPKNSKKHRK